MASDLESRRETLVNRLVEAGAEVLPNSVHHSRPPTDVDYVVWFLNEETIDVPFVNEGPPDQVSAMLDEAEETLRMATEAPER